MVNTEQNEDAPIPVIGFDHVAIAVPNLEAAMKFYNERFGCETSKPFIVGTQNIRMAYAYLGNAKLELMEPLGKGSPISKFLERNPRGGIHHICLKVPDVGAAAEGASRVGLRRLGGDKLTKGHEGQDLFFMHPRDTLGTLIEIE